jgi:hypothetical protein
VTLFVAGSIRVTVLSTSFVTHNEPAAATTAAGCFPVATVAEMVSGPGLAPATAAVRARTKTEATSALMTRLLSIVSDRRSWRVRETPL